MPASHTHHNTDAVLTHLRKCGYRITVPRTRIITALVTASTPKTVKEIMVRTKIREASTVYRTLTELVKEKLVEELHDGSTARYELTHEHHDHAICNSCGTIEHIPCVSEVKPRVLTRSGWRILSHEALYRGLCSHCAQKAIR